MTSSAKRFHVVSCHVLWRELCYFAAQSPHVFTFDFLQQGLHNTPDVLRAELQKAIDRAPGCDAILVGYGLCSNGIEGIVARATPLVVVRAHDCITFLLGSKERYRSYFDAHPGTYWYSPGWIDVSLMPGRDRLDKVRAEYAEKFGEDNADYLVEMEQGWLKKYSNAAYVDLGFGDNEHFKDFTRSCASYLGWACDVMQGSPALVCALLDGTWAPADFLVVKPGETIYATHDDAIVCARRADQSPDQAQPAV